MILSMGIGREAYYLTMGKQAETLVDIFDNCSSQEYATIEEQKQNLKGYHGGATFM